MWLIALCRALDHPGGRHPLSPVRRGGEGDRRLPAAERRERELQSAADVARTIARMAHQLIEKAALAPPGTGDVVLLGIPTRGVHLARRLAALVTEFAAV